MRNDTKGSGLRSEQILAQGRVCEKWNELVCVAIKQNQVAMG